MAHVLWVIGGLLIVGSLVVDVRNNWQSKLVLKVFPFFSGRYLILYAIKELGMIIIK